MSLTLSRFFFILISIQATCEARSGQYRIDGSTADSTKHSIRVMEDNLPDEKKRIFEQAILHIKVSNPKAGYDSSLKGPDALTDYGLLGKRINGMTFEEIMKLGGN